mgnify:CR=1 FL=1
MTIERLMQLMKWYEKENDFLICLELQCDGSGALMYFETATVFFEFNNLEELYEKLKK